MYAREEGRKIPETAAILLALAALVLAAGVIGVMIWRNSTSDRLNDAVFVRADIPERVMDDEQAIQTAVL